MIMIFMKLEHVFKENSHHLVSDENGKLGGKNKLDNGEAIKEKRWRSGERTEKNYREIMEIFNENYKI